MPPGTNSAAELGIEGLYRICRIDDPSDLVGKGEKWDDLGPCPAPALADGGITLSPEAGFERCQGFFGGRSINGPIDGLQGRSERLAIFPRHEIHRVAQQMDNTGLDHRFGEDGGDGVWEALQAIDDGQ